MPSCLTACPSPICLLSANSKTVKKQKSQNEEKNGRKGDHDNRKTSKGFMDERERTEEKKVRQLRKEEFVIYPICMTMNKAKLKPRFDIQKR